MGAAVGMALVDTGSVGLAVGTTVVCTGAAAPTGLVIDAGSALALGLGSWMMFNSGKNTMDSNRYKGSSSNGSGGSGSSGGGNKPVNRPSAKKVEIDMEEVVSGHTSGGARGKQSKIKDLFPDNMSTKDIEKEIREAYGNAKQVGSPQFDGRSTR